MSETEQDTPAEQPAEQPGTDEDFPPGGPITSPEGDDALEGNEEGDEAAWEASAEREREQELAAERQEVAQSIEAQKREQDAQRKKLDQLAAHVAKRYADILGPDLGGFVGCEMCSDYWPGVRLPIMPQPATLAAIKVAIGEDPDPPLNDDTYSRQCDTCGGYGTVKTGSHVTGQKAAQCLDCHGRGWVAVGTERESNGHTAIPAPAQPAVPVAEGFPPPPLQVDEPRTPEEDKLRQLGAIVVWPPKVPDPVSTFDSY